MRRDERGFALLQRPALAALLASLLASAAAAQEPVPPGGEPEQDLPRYTVELIVFTYAEGETDVGEIFVPEPLPETYAAPGKERPPVFGDRPSGPLSAPSESLSAPAGDLPSAPRSTPADGVPPPVGAAADSPETGSRPGAPAGRPEDPEISGFDRDLADIPLRARIELTRLPPEQYSMNRIYDKLVALDAYEPIMRAAWTQTTPPRDASPEIRLRALGDPPPGLDGTVKLYQGRFVHLGVDIALAAETAENPDDGAYDARQSATDRAIAGSGLDAGSADGRTPPGAGPVWSDSPLEAAGFPARPVRYRIDEVRIMKDGGIRYYDHPRFGVVAKLTEVKEQEKEQNPETTGDEAAFAGDD